MKITDDNDTSTEESILTKLPKDVRGYLFGFFNQKDLRTIAIANKKLKEYSTEKLNELTDKYKSNIFYTVGNPIQFSDNTSSHYILDLFPQFTYRNKIPPIEIYNSFSVKNIESLRLFANEDDAYEYSRFLRTGSHLNNGEEAFQSAIFKVNYLKEVNRCSKRKETIIINPNCHSTIYDLNERSRDIEFFEAKRFDVIPLKGILKIHLQEKEKFRDYGTVNFSSFKKENNYFNFNSCNIC
ncbi:Uncharacterised protein [Legionella busanensis]|uniref:F-box domain-containing protein n=1 Tax=Legionella busanensis TaxID=190655 RepID=A0A378JJD2_9GAMM|nr:hypothetical protein [Legionella busanensis]STX51315.1 Uncharacterised protein [Legionella busanensis]